jgi:hypothetical protein
LLVIGFGTARFKVMLLSLQADGVGMNRHDDCLGFCNLPQQVAFVEGRACATAWSSPWTTAACSADPKRLGTLLLPHPIACCWSTWGANTVPH